MKQNIQLINYDNRRNASQFDLLNLEYLLQLDEIRESLINYQKNNFYTILICTSGVGKHTIDFVDYSYQKGTVLTIRKDQIHRYHYSDSTGFLFVFTEDFFIQFFEKSEATKCLQLFNELITAPLTELDSEQYELFVPLIAEIAQEYNNLQDEYALPIVSSLLHIFLNKLLRQKSLSALQLQNRKYLPEFVKLQALVEAHCLETKKVEDYAEKMNLSTKTINNITQTIIHKSAKQFIDEIVILQIKRLLTNPNLSIKEIAYQAGFEETTNFYKYFKKYVQNTPESFRGACSKAFL